MGVGMALNTFQPGATWPESSYVLHGALLCGRVAEITSQNWTAETFPPIYQMGRCYTRGSLLPLMLILDARTTATRQKSPRLTNIAIETFWTGSICQESLRAWRPNYLLPEPQLSRKSPTYSSQRITNRRLRTRLRSTIHDIDLNTWRIQRSRLIGIELIVIKVDSACATIPPHYKRRRSYPHLHPIDVP